MNNPPSPPPSDPQPPQLDPDVVADDEALAETVDEFVRREVVARERFHWVASQQELLRQVVDADTWRLALRLDEMIVERWADVVVSVARWAFEEGRRHPLSTEEASS